MLIKSNSIQLRATCQALALLTTGLVAIDAWAATQVSSTIGLNETWTDNYFLASAGQPRAHQSVTRGNINVLLSQESRRVRTRLDYNLDAMLNGPARGDRFQDGQLLLGAEALRDWLYLDVGGNYGQYSVDPTRQVSPENTFGANNNLANVAVGRVTSTLRHKFDLFRFEAAYSAGVARLTRTDNLSATLPDDSRFRDSRLLLGSSDADARLSWSGEFHQERVRFDSGRRVAHDVATANVGWRVARPLTLLLQGGRESDPRLINATGGLDQSSWMAGIDLKHRRGELRLMGGRGVFGDIYDGSLTAAGRTVRLNFEYHEQTTTQTQQFLPQLVAGASTDGDAQFGSAAGSALNDPFARLNPDVFLQKRLNGRVALTGRRTTIELTGRAERRSYLVSGSRDNIRGASLLVSRSLGTRSRAELYGRYDTVDVLGGSSFRDESYALRFYRQLGSRLQLTLAASQWRLSPPRSVTATWYTAGLAMSLGRGGGSVSPSAPAGDTGAMPGTR